MGNKDINIPNHLAIILDGNGRWAKNRGFSRTEGHKEGVKNLEMLIKECKELSIKYLTLYIFSTENWKRPVFEVNNLMLLLNKYLTDKAEVLFDEGVRLNVIGEITGLPSKTFRLIQDVVQKTRNNSRLVLSLAVNYGSRNEIINAIKKISEDVLNGILNLNDINENLFSNYLYTNGLPDPDLLIRTSGEYRLSNFLLWQCAYTEFWYTDILWPDFRKENLYEAIESFSKRKRRFGRVSNES